MIFTETTGATLKASPIDIHWTQGLPVFASESFLKAVGDGYGWLGGKDEGGNLRCLLPYTVVRKPGFRMVRFRVETIRLDKDLTFDEEHCFLNSVIDYFRSIGADMVLPANNTALFRAYPDGAIVAPYGTVIKVLEKPEDALWSELQTDCRQNIRKAIKSGVQVKCGTEYLDAAYRLIANTLNRSGLMFRKEAYFKQMISGLGDDVKIFVAEHQGIMQACMISPFSHHSAYDWYSGTISKPMRGAMHLLVWEAIRQFREAGVKRFNFTGIRIDPQKGSKQEGIRNFKTRFGGQVEEGYIWKYSFHPLKFMAYAAAEYVLMGGETLPFKSAK